MNARQTSGPNAATVASTSSATVAAAAAIVRQCPPERQRNHQAELRLVGKQAEQQPGDDRPAVEQRERAAEERGGEQAVLAMAEIDEHRREGEGEENPQAIRGRPGAGLRRRGRAQHGPHRQQIERQGRALPEREREPIGQPRQRGGDE
jgi:hypothetical protein